MRMKRTINVPVSFVYHKLIEAVLADIKAQTGKTILADHLKGFEYKKTFSNHTVGKLKIINLIPNREYEYMTETPEMHFHVRYLLSEISEHQTGLVYEEKMETKVLAKKINNKFMAVLTGFFKKRSFMKMFDRIEQSYV